MKKKEPKRLYRRYIFSVFPDLVFFIINILFQFCFVRYSFIELFFHFIDVDIESKNCFEVFQKSEFERNEIFQDKLWI